MQALGRRARGQLQQQPLGGESLSLRGQRVPQRRPQCVEQQRILARLLRKEALGQAGHEDDAKAAAARLLRSPDEDAAEAPGRRLRFERQQTIAQHPARLVQVDRADVGHRPKIRQNAEHVRGPTQHARRERGKTLQPFAPRGAAAAIARAGPRQAGRTTGDARAVRESVEGRALWGCRHPPAVRPPRSAGVARRPCPPGDAPSATRLLR